MDSLFSARWALDHRGMQNVKVAQELHNYQGKYVIVTCHCMAINSISLKGPFRPLPCFSLHLGTRLTKLLQISTKKILNHQEE